MAIAALVLVFLVLAIIITTGISVYNGLISLRNQVSRAWANIDVILKQRFDEIPQLVQILEQFVQHEKSVIQKIMDARAHYGSARTSDEKIQSAQEMSLALKGVIAIGEGYPELKSNQNFINLQTRLSTLEDHLADRREIYNEAVTNWNTRIAQFPDVIFANSMQLCEMPLFQISQVEKGMPNLKLNIGN